MRKGRFLDCTYFLGKINALVYREGTVYHTKRCFRELDPNYRWILYMPSELLSNTKETYDK